MVHRLDSLNGEVGRSLNGLARVRVDAAEARLAVLGDIRVEGKPQQTSFIVIGFVESAEDTQGLHETALYVEERLGSELPVLDDTDHTRLVDNHEPPGLPRVRDKSDGRRQAGRDGLQVDGNRRLANSLGNR